MTGRWMYWNEELCQEHNDLVGKKCANLGEMTKMGLRVPPGFALSVEAYKDFMDLTGAGEEIREYLGQVGSLTETIEGLREIRDHLRLIVESKEMPSDMLNQVLAFYRELSDKCGEDAVSVSTRSAGATSHPGQFETHLHVQGELDVVEKIKKVWSSTFNTRSLSARKQKGLPLDSSPIGVAVLKMVNARAAGVIFTADPNTGDKSRTIIEANWGLGESVVGGDSMPDVYILDKNSLDVIESRLGSKSKYVIFQGAGVAEFKTPATKRNAFCLTTEEAQEIARLGKMLEEYFGVPQDAEWAIDRNSEFPTSVVLLQTRPEMIVEQRDPVDQVLDFMMDRLGV